MKKMSAAETDQKKSDYYYFEVGADHVAAEDYEKTVVGCFQKKFDYYYLVKGRHCFC